MVKNFQAFSNRVEIILLPKNGDWIQYPPEARERLDNVIRRIENETGIKVLDMQDVPEITPDMYTDTTHLGRYTGDIPFTRLLKDEMVPVLRKGR